MVVDSAAATPAPVVETAQPTPAPTPEPTPVEAPKRAARQEAPPKPAPAAPSSGAPVAGQTYLQLAATSKHEADIEVDVLRKKGFKAITAEIAEKPGTFRVLVGPIGDVGVNKTKSDLNAAGFPGDRAIRRIF